ncbi:ATP-dependent DNA helicase MER3 [Pseudocercospora fuligena]|uniref:DNA 3'-5' helicase n=1 Tax=Pseudocercospora fuligena TaxID=685502 RepID=A0A8H6RA95_9PEZI|nr:ATP-dependent DNA helicase MER3 [Pseudocercospora fuligena]
MTDQHIFDQLDRLECGARDLGFARGRYGASGGNEQYTHESYGQQITGHFDDAYSQPQDDFVDQPMQLDAFDERLLRQPDYDSRHGQAAMGRARLSLEPRSTFGRPRDERDLYHHAPGGTQGRPRSRHLDLSQYAHFDQPTSPQLRAQPSSPAFNASQRYHAPVNNGNGRLESTFDEDDRPRHRRTSSQRFSYHEHTAEKAEPDHQTLAQPVVAPKARESGNEAPIVQGIRLVPTRQLPDRFRAIFPFPLLNAVQSKCFPVIYKTNDNFVLSSPTGSGKTAILELAICRLINGYTNGTFKIVYQAPTKSLCAERQRDWQAKFGPLDLQCAELTGDTDNAQLRNVQHASIIITTPEKWDSMTRKWKDHQKLMQMVKLFLIDEVHILKEDRGPTLEAVVSRMKSVGSDVRFVALSATVPNSQDIATWLGKDAMNPGIPAPRERFGEEFRPVRLQRHVCGYQGPSNDFAFDKVLDSKLPDIIAKYSQRKPIMVFCFTRKACVETAKLLTTWWSDAGPRDRYWNAPRGRVQIVDKDLRERVASGVAFHHAGLTAEDRTAIEKGYLGGEIGVICCTSTLAVGVNLPCHMVIIKNTVTYTQGNGLKEYSDLEVMQMLGRAGRPQFDDSAVAVIMTRLQKQETYEKMVSGSEVLESRLHLNLIEHLNAEIGLGTVNNLSSAKKWLAGTFLYVRLKDNPEHYAIEGDAPGSSIDERLEKICRQGITRLEENDLIKGTIKYQCTEFGDSMSRYYIQFETMKSLLALPSKAKISEILSTMAQAAEFKEVRFRQGEKPPYKELNKNNSIKFPIPGTLEHSACKVSLIIQSVLGAVELPTEDVKHTMEYRTSKAIIWQHAHRLIRCIIDCQLYLDDAVTARNALMLARSLGGQVWDDSPLHMKQLEGIGFVFVRKLVNAGIRSIVDLESIEAYRIEQILSRNPPFGAQVHEQAKAFPRLRIGLKIVGEHVVKKGEHVTVKVKAEIGFLNDKAPLMFQRKPVYICLLADTSDGHKLHFARISAKKMEKGMDVLFSANLTSQGQVIRAFLMCDDIAGTQQTAMLKPEIPSYSFPTPKMLEDAKNHSQELKINAPNTSKRRLAAAGSQTAANDEEFGDAGLEDADLAAAGNDDFADLDDFDDSGAPLKHKTNLSSKNSIEHYEPRQLPSGRWQCNHKCKKKCKHECCEIGLEKKPKPPKPKEAKEPKKVSAASEPRQTQLDLTKTKKNTASSFQNPASTAPPRKASTSKEARDIEKLHDKIPNSTPAVPLLNRSKPATLQSAPLPSFLHEPSDNRDDDFGLNDLLSDDFPTDSELLTTAPASHMSPSIHPGSGSHDNEHLDDEDEMLDELEDDGFGLNEDTTFDMPRQNQNGSPSPLSSLDYHIQAMSKGKDKSMFITGESTDSIENQPKHKLDDTGSRHQGPVMKKAKRTPSNRDFGNVLEPNLVQGQVEDFIPDLPQAPEPQEEEKEDDLKAWFEKEFGTEHFNYIG